MIRARTSPAPQHTSFQIHNGSFPPQVTQDELEKPKENFALVWPWESRALDGPCWRVAWRSSWTAWGRS
jgi:hypothetical protein